MHIEKRVSSSIILAQASRGASMPRARSMNDIEFNEEADRLILGGLSTTIPLLLLRGEADPVPGSEYKNLPPFSANQRFIALPQARHFSHD